MERFFLLSDPTNKPLWNGISIPGGHVINRDCMDFQCMVIKNQKNRWFFFSFFLLFGIFFNTHCAIHFIKKWKKNPASLICLVKPLGNDIPCIALVMVRIIFPGGGSNVPQWLKIIPSRPLSHNRDTTRQGNPYHHSCYARNVPYTVKKINLIQIEYLEFRITLLVFRTFLLIKYSL